MSRTAEDEQQDFVKESLFQFVRKHIPSAQLSCIDDIVLSYVVSIVEDLASESGVQEAFDVEGFCEMVAAYFPQFSTIGHAAVSQWMYQLEHALRKSKRGKDGQDLCRMFHNDLMISTPPTRLNGPTESKRVHQLSETSEASSDSSGEYSGLEDGPSTATCLLREMFPLACEPELRHCLSVADGDIGRAVQLILHRQENGQALQVNVLGQPVVGQKSVADDDELKTRIINRYSYVDKDDDAREHRPIGPKVVPKKLVRYRDNKIVSLKGERFTDVKDDQDEDAKKSASKTQRHCRRD